MLGQNANRVAHSQKLAKVVEPKQAGGMIQKPFTAMRYDTLPESYRKNVILFTAAKVGRANYWLWKGSYCWICIIVEMHRLVRTAQLSLIVHFIIFPTNKYVKTILVYFFLFKCLKLIWLTFISYYIQSLRKKENWKWGIYFISTLCLVSCKVLPLNLYTG